MNTIPLNQPRLLTKRYQKSEINKSNNSQTLPFDLGSYTKNQSINRNLLESYIITPLRMLTFPRAFVGLRQRDADNMPSLPCNLFDTSFDLIIVLKDLIFIDSHTGKIYYTIPISNVTGPCEQFPNL